MSRIRYFCEMAEWQNDGNGGNDGNGPKGIAKNRLIRLLLLLSGWMSVGLAVIGIILPLVPTTPFLILASICFYKSSNRFYTWLYTNRIFGKYLQDYKEKKGIPVRVKIWTLLFLWISLLVSVCLVPVLWVRIFLLLIGTAVTIHLMWIRTKKT